MIFTYDLTIASAMNEGQPVLGRATRALASDTTPIHPVRFLYYPQLVPLEEAPDDGLPIIIDDESRYHADLAGRNPAKLLAMMTEYAGVIRRIKTKCPSCPIGVYGFLPDQAADRGLTQDQWFPARKRVSDLMDFVFIELGDGQTSAPVFDVLLARIDSVKMEFRLPVMVKICPENMADAEFSRRLEIIASDSRIDQCCIWVGVGATWPDPSVDTKQFPPTLTGNYAQIAKSIARKYPRGKKIRPQ